MKPTAKNMVEQELRASEQRYRLLADNITDVIWTIDLEGNFTYVSPSVERLRGFTPEEVMELPITEALTPDSLKIVLESLEQLRNIEVAAGDLSDVDNRFELEQPCKDGSTVWTEVVANILRDDQDNIIGILGVTRDITERKRAEVVLQQAHDELAVRVSELAMLNHIAETVATATDVQAALEILAEQMVILFEAASCITTLLSSDQSGLRVLAHFQQRKTFPSLVGTIFSFDDHLANWTVVKSGEPVMVTQDMSEAIGQVTYEWMKVQNLECLLIVPMLVRDRIIGTISVSTDLPGRIFTPAEVSLAKTIAGQVAGTIENARLVKEEQRQRKLAESLREVAMVLNTSLELETVLNTILDLIGQVILHDGAAIFLSDGDDLILTAGVVMDESLVGYHIPISGQSLEARVYRQKRGLVIADVHDEPNWISWVSPEPIHGWMGAPLFVGEKVIGIITADNFEIGAFTEEDGQILQTFANQVAMAIENARQVRRTEEALHETQVLNRIASILAKSADIQQGIEEALGEYLQALGLNQGGISLFSQDRQSAKLYALYMDGQPRPIGLPMNIVSLVYQEIIKTKRPVAIYDAYNDPLLLDNRDLTIAHQIKSILLVPLLVRGEVIGVLGADTTAEHHHFSDRETYLAQAVADQIATAVENARLFDEERRQRQMAESLREVALILNSSLDLDTVLGKIYGQLQQVISIDSAGIFLKEGPDLVLISGTELDMPFIGTQVSLSSDDIAVRVFENREPLIIADVHQSPYREVWFGDKNLRTWMGVPLLVGETVIGVLTVDSFRVGAYTEKDAHILQIFAAQAATAIENARRFEAEHKALEQAKTLYTASLALSATIDLPQVLERILTELRRVVPYDSASVQELKGDYLEIVSGTGFPNPAEIIGLTFDFGKSDLNRELAQTQVPIILEDAALHPEFQVAPHSELGIRAWMGIPLLFGDRFIGKISIDKKTPGFYDEATAQLAMSFAVQAAIAIENARLLNETQEARKAAEAANKAKSTFLATMSHELRTPLNAILGYAQLIKRDPASTESQREGLEIIDQSGSHLLTIVNDLLDIAKIEAGRVDLHLTEIHLPDFLRSICEIIGIRAERKGITFHAQFPPPGELPREVRVDEKRLRQVLINLLGNGVKFTNSGQVTFRAETVSPPVSGDGGSEQVPADGALMAGPRVTIRFTVQDTGIGISPDELQSIFEPFYQTGELKHRAEGTGLGLAICINLLDLMDSQLYVESEVGQGSKFWFDLTLERAYPEPAHQSRGSALAEPLIIPPAEEMSILYDLSLRGDVDELRRRATELAASNRQYERFAARLEQLACQFQLNEITELLKGYLE